MSLPRKSTPPSRIADDGTKPVPYIDVYAYLLECAGAGDRTDHTVRAELFVRLEANALHLYRE